MEHEAEAKVALLAEFHAKEKVLTTKTEEPRVCIDIIEENQNQERKKPGASSDKSPEPYKPELISIGPYNYVKETENGIKRNFQKSFFGGNSDLTIKCGEKLSGLEAEARKWYAENIGQQINDQQLDSFGEMLLLDGCFILELFYRMNRSAQDDDASKNVEKEVAQTITTFMKDHAKVATTLNDLLLIKNELPFFVLIELHKLKSYYRDDGVAESDDHQNDKDNDDALLRKCIALMKTYKGNDAMPASDDALLLFIKLLKKYDDGALQRKLDKLMNDAGLRKVYEAMKEYNYKALQKELMVLKGDDAAAAGALLKKLMELVEDYALPQQLVVLVKKSFANMVPKLTPQNVAAHESEPKHLLGLVHNLCIPRSSKSEDTTCGGITEQINTATELEKDGVRFKKIGNVYQGYRDEKGPTFNAYDGTTLFDIDFNWGRLKIPCFKIEDPTETFFKNMIAYEQHHKSDADEPPIPKYYTDFAWFMAQLVRTKEDVSLLRRRGIILNMLSTDEEVAKMFNEMSKGLVVSNTFSRVYSKANRFVEKPWIIQLGQMVRGIYYTPWKLISTVLGGLIISLGAAVSIKNLLN